MCCVYKWHANGVINITRVRQTCVPDRSRVLREGGGAAYFRPVKSDRTPLRVGRFRDFPIVRADRAFMLSISSQDIEEARDFGPI